jgi:hypothetical protein
MSQVLLPSNRTGAASMSSLLVRRVLRPPGGFGRSMGCGGTL